MKRAMDGITLEIPLFLFATFAGAFVAGLSGFAFGLVVQGYSVWKLRGALDWPKLWPFMAGAAIGVPAGVMLLTWSDPRSVRIAVAIILILYSAYAFFRPTLKFSGGGRASDAAVGFLNGVLGGLTGLAGILVTIWCGLR